MNLDAIKDLGIGFIPQFEKFYVLKYDGDLCLSEQIDELNYYLSMGATVKHLQVVQLDNYRTIHSMVIIIQENVLRKAPFNP